MAIRTDELAPFASVFRLGNGSAVGFAMLQPRSALGYAMVAVAATLFAVNGTVSKVVLASGISSGQLTEVRCAGALVGMTFIAALTRPGSLRLGPAELPLLVALGIGLALVQWSYFFAIHRLDIGIALLIQYVASILVALWALRLPRSRQTSHLGGARALSRWTGADRRGLASGTA